MHLNKFFCAPKNIVQCNQKNSPVHLKNIPSAFKKISSAPRKFSSATNRFNISGGGPKGVLSEDLPAQRSLKIPSQHHNAPDYWGPIWPFPSLYNGHQVCLQMSNAHLLFLSAAEFVSLPEWQFNGYTVGRKGKVCKAPQFSVSTFIIKLFSHVRCPTMAIAWNSHWKEAHLRCLSTSSYWQVRIQWPSESA